MSSSSLSRYNNANPLVPIDRKSPPLPFTASTRAGRPDTGSVRSSFELVLPPPKFVMRKSAPSKLDRYRRSSRGRCSSAAASFSSHKSCNSPDAAANERADASESAERSGDCGPPASDAVGEPAGAKPLGSCLDTHDLPVFLKPAVVRRPAIGRDGIESLHGK